MMFSPLRGWGLSQSGFSRKLDFSRKLRMLSGGWLGGLLLSTLTANLLPHPVKAAERVTLTYGFFEISTSVEALRAYAERGEPDEELAPYLDFLSDSQQQQFRSALQAKQDISPVEISQFLHSSIGSNILRYMGSIIQTQGRRDGAKGLRGALVLAAAEPEGLSLLGVMEKFPTGAIRVDAMQAFRAYGAFTGLIKDTETAIAAIERQSALAPDVPGTTGIGALAQPGPFEVEIQFLRVVDEGRSRVLPTDLYLPVGESSAPLVLVSHGLAGDRKGFIELFEHLASHGYVVAALDHPGSNTNQLLSLFEGTTDEIAEPSEFTDRPADVSYLLNELLRHNQPQGLFANRIDADKIGIIGHSFGGYTALALAGAQLNYDNLRTNCESDEFIFNAANPSMLLQCTALADPDQFGLDVRDERIKAVITLNPFTSSIFGMEGFSQIQIPSLTIAGSNDPIAPALLEQIRPFTWLHPSPDLSEQVSEPAVSDPVSVPVSNPASDHFLALIEGGSHLYDLPDLANSPEANSPEANSPEVNSPEVILAGELINADIPLAHSYLNALSLGFLEAELEQDTRYKQLLKDATVLQLGQPPLPLFIVNVLTEAMLMPPESLAPVPAVPAPDAPDPAAPLPAEIPAEIPAEN